MSQSMIIAESILPNEREPETAIIRELDTKIGGGDITFEQPNQALHSHGFEI